jgi:hypothetical protein
MVSSVIDRLFNAMDELYKKIIFVHLLCAWCMAFFRLMFAISINTISVEATLMNALACLKYLEVIFRNLAMATNFVMVYMYAFTIHAASKGEDRHLSKTPRWLCGVYVFFGLFSVFQMGISAKLEVSRTYMVWNGTNSYKAVQQVIMGILIVFWLCTQLAAIVLAILARFKYSGLMHYNPKLFRMNMTFFQLMMSFTLFNLPSAFTSIVDIVTANGVATHVFETVLSWKSLQGAMDAVIVYNMFFKQRDDLTFQLDPKKPSSSTEHT